jgi:UDP-N-acetylglucosamine 1-carboxyvinyltransferase
MIPFVNFLNKVGARFEFDDTSLKVWRNEERLESVQLTVAHTPGFLSTWSSLAVLLLSQVAGDSTVADTVNLNSFDYTKDLNRMGAKIEVVTPSQAGTPLVITDERFDPETSAEPETVARISGATKLHATKLNMANFNAGPVLALACLCADGKSELYNYEVIEKYMEQFFDKLKALGAHIWKRQA